MITLSELIDDPTYRKFMHRLPNLGPHTQPPWRLYVQREMDGPWGKKDFEEYEEALNTLKRFLDRGVHNATIQCRPTGFKPPRKIVRVTRDGRPVMIKRGGKEIPKTQLIPWRPKVSTDQASHTWCPYCRRPTIFRWFTKHHALPPEFDPSVQRCTICGVSEVFVRTTPDSFLRGV